jgi:four helix bundle protein
MPLLRISARGFLPTFLNGGIGTRAFLCEINWIGLCVAERMTPDELKHRTRTFALEIIKLAKSLPNDFVTAHIARQLMRSGTSVGANYRSSSRAKSEADFISKMATVEEEADESGYWLELLIETDAVSPRAIAA